MNEFMLPLHTQTPHLICMTEHHLKDYEIEATHIPKYKLGAKRCREKLKNGGVCIYTQEALKFTKVNLQKHCKEQDIEIAAIQIKFQEKNVIIFCTYRAPSVLSKVILAAKKSHYNKIILNSKNKMRSTWKIINDEQGKTKQDTDNQSLVVDKETKNSSGYDEVSNRIIKLSSPFIISPLTCICNAILSTGVFPDRLKYAIVKPVSKKGNRQEISNYRPISLLTSFSKIIEKLIYARLLAHIHTNSILAHEQYGFRTHSSTEKAAFALVNSVLTAVNNNLIVGGIFCDLQKAFDCVNHKILLDKLEFYGIEGKLKTLIESYLTGRHQRVTLGSKTDSNNSSNWEVIKCGVPQGSILGPLFFLCYINDLPKIISKENNMVLFADDTSIIITDTNKLDFNINVNQTFEDINTWFQANILTLNFNKTHYLEFKTKNYYNVKTQITYDEESITNATEIKFLGLIIDDTLSWRQHIDQIISKISTACYALRNIKHIVPLDTLKVIYFAHIHSIISYGIILWGCSSYANKVFLLQKKIIRIITNTKPRDSCREIFKNMEIMTLYSQYIYSLTLYTINNKHLFNTNNEIHKYRTRYNNNLHLPIVNLSKFHKGAYISGVKIFNHLPQYIKILANDQNRFKSTLKRFLYHHSFYSMDEYYEFKEDSNV
ncbi:hypothetical protein Cfor_01706 [Coptotermes formosanus]|uniref:Reverse transcriptase domain-containing protein n=1 Tax=Coptotermes formosanus TaxID=36987 RepID=A0A6L2PDS0_COPFO|nr:hypothetical protein Cfor_01706 [Coptotermes formosanus]